MLSNPPAAATNRVAFIVLDLDDDFILTLTPRTLVNILVDVYKAGSVMPR